MKFPAILSLGLILSVFSATAAPREWTDQATGRKISADFVSLNGDQVTLSINGKEYNLPVARLSAEDQAYLKVVGDAPAMPKEAPEQVSPVAAKPGGNSKVVGPIDVEWSDYYYYIPASAKTGQSFAILSFFT